MEYEVGVFERREGEGEANGKGRDGGDEREEEGKEEQVKAVGKFVHVCVERKTGRTVGEGMGEEVRRGLRGLVVGGQEGNGKRAKL